MNNVVMLSELCETEITDGTHQTPTYSDDGYIFLSSKNVTSGVIDWENVKYIPEKLHQELYARIKPQKDDILLAKNGTTGTAALVDRDEVFDIYVSLALIRPNKNKVLPEYLLYAINSRNSQLFFERHLKGIGVPNLHLTHIRETPIKIYSFDRQKKIVEELKCIDEVIRKHEQQIDIYNHLVKSRFIETFGDPNDETLSDKRKSIEDVCDNIYGGGTPSKSHKEYYIGNIPWVTPKDMKSMSIDDSQDHITSEAIENSTTKLIPKKSVLMVIRSGILKHTLPVAINNVEVTINQDMKAFVPSSILTPEYLLHTFKMMEESILSKVRGVTADNIEFIEFKKRQIFIPPIEIQNQFADFVALTDKSKHAVQQSIETLQTLKAKLMQDYFG